MVRARAWHKPLGKDRLKIGIFHNKTRNRVVRGEEEMETFWMVHSLSEKILFCINYESF